MFIINEADAPLAVQLHWVLARKRMLQAVVTCFADHGDEYGTSQFLKYITNALCAPTAGVVPPPPSPPCRHLSFSPPHRLRPSRTARGSRLNGMIGGAGL